MIGDARQTMAKEQDSSFDLFIIDAFTSDAIPVHMLTAEAVKMYLAKLKPDGVVLLHTSNRYLDLDSVLGAIHHQELPPGTAGIVVSDSNADGSYSQSTSTVVIFAKSEEALAPYRSMDGVRGTRRRRHARMDRRLLRHPGSVHEPAAGSGITRMVLAPMTSARRSGAIGKTASGVPAAAQTTS